MTGPGVITSLRKVLEVAGHRPEKDKGDSWTAACPACFDAGVADRDSLSVSLGALGRIHLTCWNESCPAGDDEGGAMSAAFRKMIGEPFIAWERRGEGRGKLEPGEAVTALPAVASPEATGFVLASQVSSERVDWLWTDRIPRGAVTILVGDPGTGKSLLTCELAARVSRGQAIPPGPASAPEMVAMLTAEDALGAVVRPRLEAAGADLDRVALWQGDGGEPITFPSGIDALRDWMREHRPALVVIDPIVAFLDAGLNGHRDQDVRRALRPLAELAAETGTAILVVMHLNKASGGQPLYRLGGSIGFAGAARSVLLFGRKPDGDDDDPTRLVAVVKSSYSAIAPAVGLSLAVREGTGHPTCEWGGVVKVYAADMLRAPGDGEERSAVAEAVEFLRAELDGQGESSAKEVQATARDAGISKTTLYAARTRLGVVTTREGFGPGGVWFWSLPEGVPSIDSDPLEPMGEPPAPNLWGSPVPMRDYDPTNTASPSIGSESRGMEPTGESEPAGSLHETLVEMMLEALANGTMSADTDPGNDSPPVRAAWVEASRLFHEASA